MIENVTVPPQELKIALLFCDTKSLFVETKVTVGVTASLDQQLGFL